MLLSLATALLLLIADPQSSPPDRTEAEQLARAGRTEEAIGLFAQIAAQDPQDIEARLWVARLTLRLGRTADATAEFRSVLEQRPNDVDARIGLGIALTRSGAWQEALTILSEAEPAAGENADLFSALALAYRRSGDDRRAFEYFTRARALAQHDPDPEGVAQPATRACQPLVWCLTPRNANGRLGSVRFRSEQNAVTNTVKRRSEDALPAPRGPSLRGVPFQDLAGAGLVELLSEAQRHHLARLATVQHLPVRSIVYRAGGVADAVFIIAEGAVKSFRDLPSGRCRVAAFLFADDLFGLAAAGRYVNTTQAMTPLTVYRLDLTHLADAFRHDADLELRFLCKAVHELREAQHHAIIVGRRHAAGRLAMLLHMLERNRPTRHGDVFIPMTRSDMANYLGLTLESVVRASRRLERQGIVDFADRQHARIRDRRRFEELVASV